MILTRHFLIFILAFSAAVFAASFYSFTYYFAFFLLFLSIIFLVVQKHFFVLALIFFALGAGIFWYEFKAAPPDTSFLDGKVNTQITLEGVIIDEPDERENYTRLILEAGKKVKILITTERYPEFKYGDKVKVAGVLKRPGKFQVFDWGAYLRKDDIYFEIFYPQIEFVKANQAFFVKQKLFELKNKILFNISRVIPEPHSALLGGLTFGAKRSMPSELLEDFRRTGIIHIIVLSGYNVTIVADAIMRLFSFFPQLIGIGFGILAIICFALMAGASATVVRASLMAIFVLLARATGRIYEITIALFMAGFLMILHNPKILRFDSSFQLSFLATLALIYLAPILEPRLKFFPKKFKIREFATATLATQIFVLPLLLYKMGLFSVVSLPVNLLILIFIPATMFFGFLTAIISIPFGWIAYGLLAYELKIVEIFASLPFASFNISNFPLWLMLLVYTVYAILIHKFHRNKNVNVAR